MPLVLHGGTGIPADMIQESHFSWRMLRLMLIQNASFHLLMLQESILKQAKILKVKGFDPRKLLAPGCEAIKETVREKINLFGSAGKA